MLPGQVLDSKIVVLGHNDSVLAIRDRRDLDVGEDRSAWVLLDVASVVTMAAQVHCEP